MSDRMITGFIFTLYFLFACVSCQNSFRCYMTEELIKKTQKKEMVKKCGFHKGKDFTNDAEFLTNVIDLHFDPTKSENILFIVKIGQNPSAKSGTTDADISATILNLNTLADRVETEYNSQSKLVFYDCPNCFDSQGNPNQDCSMDRRYHQLSKHALNHFPDASVSILFCNIDKSVFLTQEEALAQCPKSITGVWGSERLAGGSNLHFGAIIIPSCIDKTGKVTPGKRVLHNKNSNEPLFSVCNGPGTFLEHLESQKLRVVTPSFALDPTQVADKQGAFQASQQTNLVPIGSPAFTSFLTCTISETEFNDFRIYFKAPLTAAMFESPISGITDLTATESVGQYLDKIPRARSSNRLVV